MPLQNLQLLKKMKITYLHHHQKMVISEYGDLPKINR